MEKKKIFIMPDIQVITFSNEDVVLVQSPRFGQNPNEADYVIDGGFWG